MIIRLQDLEYLNLAVNNVTKIQNLQRCESLKKLDLTINFIPKAGLLTMESLQHNVHLEELYLLGNPCSDWPGYRQYIIGTLPRLKKLVRAHPASTLACAPWIHVMTTWSTRGIPALLDTHSAARRVMHGNPCMRVHARARKHQRRLPCAWPHVLQDGQDVKHSERILAAQALPGLEAQLRAELLAEGIDPATAAQVSLRIRV